MIAGSSRAALRALHDVTVVRAPAWHSGYQDLVRRGLATAKGFPRHEDDPIPRRDYRLTLRGRIFAEETFR